MLHPFDDREVEHARPGGEPDEHGLHARWLSRHGLLGRRYALGSECRDLPAFVAIPDPRGVPQVGPNHWNAAFLPAVFQGTAFNAEKPIPHLARRPRSARRPTLATRDFLQLLNERHLAEHPGDSELAARIASYELAAKMQLAARGGRAIFPARAPATFALYGADDTANKIESAALRRTASSRGGSLERGVRFVQLFNGAYAMGEGVGNWDGHKTLKQQYDVHAPILDQPCAALLRDLQASVVCSTTRSSPSSPNLAGCRRSKKARADATTIRTASPSGSRARA